MAHPNLPQVPHSGFPQVYDGQLFNSLSVMVEEAFALATCSHTTPESIPGACDGGYPCPEVCLFGSEFCGKHQGESL